MGTIGDLPEDVILEVLSFVPAPHLVRSCRLVCSRWRDLVDLSALWKLKCHQKGYHTKRLNQDWRSFYFLCGLQRNLMKHPGLSASEDEFNDWRRLRCIDHLDFRKYCALSCGPCNYLQLYCLTDEGYWDELMDKIRPDIVVKGWYAERCHFSVQLLTWDCFIIEEFDSERHSVFHSDDPIFKLGNVCWREVSYTFHNYPPGVRHIHFIRSGEDMELYTGRYRRQITRRSSLTIGPEVAE